MCIEIKAPSFPESIAEGTLLNWHCAPGDRVARDQLLVEIETDKVVMEVAAPEAGLLADVLVTKGERCTSEQLLGRLARSEINAPNLLASAAQTDGEWRLAPAARKLVAEHGVDISTLTGSGRGGRILKEDVQRKLQGTASVIRADRPHGEDEDEFLPRQDMRVPMSRLRQTIADRLVRAQQTAAMLTTYNEVDTSAIRALRARYQDRFQKAHGVKLGFMGFFVKACTEALKRFPDVNASIDGDDIVYHGYQDIGVAVSTDRGLVVPVLRDTDTLKLADVEHQIADFSARGRENRLTLDEMTGGTFTITNGGVFGSLLSTPILNPPQTAILGMHKIEDRPVALNGEVVIRPMMYLALSYDHRMIDGKDAVQFLVTVKSFLEDPARMLLGV